MRSLVAIRRARPRPRHGTRRITYHPPRPQNRDCGTAYRLPRDEVAPVILRNRIHSSIPHAQYPCNETASRAHPVGRRGITSECEAVGNATTRQSRSRFACTRMRVPSRNFAFRRIVVPCFECDSNRAISCTNFAACSV